MIGTDQQARRLQPQRPQAQRPRAALLVLCAMAVLTLGTFVAGVVQSGGAEVELATAGAAPERVVVVTAPRVRWEDVGDSMPNLSAFAADAAIASTSVRTLGPLTDPPEAYLTLGAGNRAGSAPWPPVLLDGPGLVYGPDEQVGGEPAAAVYEEATGTDAGGVALALNIAEIRAYNESLKYGAEVGSLAEALDGADRTIAAVGNADMVDPQRRSRSVGLMGMTADGQLAAGSVSPNLLQPDVQSAGETRLNPEAVGEATAVALQQADVVVVELSDMERAEAVSRADDADRPAVAAKTGQLRQRALEQSDEVLGEVLALADPKTDLVMVITPDSPGQPSQLGVFAAQGPGLTPGWVKSSTTRRAGYVTLTDVAPTILSSFGIDAPESMPDTRLIRSGDRDGALPIDSLSTANDRSVCILTTHDPAAGVFVILLVLLVLAAAALRQWRPGLLKYLALPSLALMAVPGVSYFLGVVGPLACVPAPIYIATMLVSSAVVGAIAWRIARARVEGAVVLVAAFSFLVLVVDLWTGGWLQMDTVFGYSPQVAGRFAGLGNLAFALLAVAALILATMGQALVWPPSKDGPEPVLGGKAPPVRAPRDARIAVALLAVTTIVVDGHPSLGSDVGGVLALVPAFSIVMLRQSGRRIRPRLVGLIGLGTVGVLLGFGAIDLSRPPEQRTHLGRFLQSVVGGDGGQIISRKIDANLSILTSSVWSLLLPVAAVLLAYLATRPNSPLTQLRVRVPGLTMLGESAMICGVLGAALNDSGVAVLGVFLAVLVPLVLFLFVLLDETNTGYPDSTGLRPVEDDW